MKGETYYKERLKYFKHLDNPNHKITCIKAEISFYKEMLEERNHNLIENYIEGLESELDRISKLIN